jgi:transcriptional regulator with XRE-family HTH domain
MPRHVPITSDSSATYPLGVLIAQERQKRSLSRPELAALVRKRLKVNGTNASAIQRWELRGDIPVPATMRALADVFEMPVERLSEAANAQKQERENPCELIPATLDMPSAEPATYEFLGSMRRAMSTIVSLEVQFGGDDVAPLALRTFRKVRDRIAVGGHPASLERDLLAAAGEMAEIAGWLLHDADQQEAARQVSIEALTLSHLAGDRSIELLTMSNLAFFALFQKRPGDALMLARRALSDARLTHRQRVIFQLREARSLAQLGARTEAIRGAERAQSAFLDGGTSTDKEWEWWVDPSEVVGHAAWTHIEAGEPARAAALLQDAVEACPREHVNSRFFRMARFLDATIASSAWSDVGEVIRRLTPYASEVRSGRTVRLLKESARRIEQSSPPSAVREGSRHLVSILTANGYH